MRARARWRGAGHGTHRALLLHAGGQPPQGLLVHARLCNGVVVGQARGRKPRSELANVPCTETRGGRRVGPSEWGKSAGRQRVKKLGRQGTGQQRGGRPPRTFSQHVVDDRHLSPPSSVRTQEKNTLFLFFLEFSDWLVCACGFTKGPGGISPAHIFTSCHAQGRRGARAAPGGPRGPAH